jgi:hypothetical protein
MGRIKVWTGCWWGSLREIGHLGDQDIDGSIILRWIFRKLGAGVVGTGWSWQRIGTVFGHFGYSEGLSGSINAGNFLTSCKVYWLASQEGLCSKE